MGAGGLRRPESAWDEASGLLGAMGWAGDILYACRRLLNGFPPRQLLRL